MSHPKPVPPGMYVELTLDLINEGRFRQQVNEAIQLGIRDLTDWEQAMERKDGTFTVTAKVTVGRVRGSEDHFLINGQVQLKTPCVSQTSMSKAAGGRLLCQPDGSTRDDPDQLRMFNAHGEPKGVLNVSTGELVEQDPVVGRVGAS